jgi:hypothetical protein
MTYIAVESADAAAEKAASLGGTVLAGAFDVMDVGRMAIIQIRKTQHFVYGKQRLILAPGSSGRLARSVGMSSGRQIARRLRSSTKGSLDGEPKKEAWVSKGSTPNGKAAVNRSAG